MNADSPIRKERSGRGVLYVIWPGDDRTEAMLERSIASVKAVHPELPIRVERLPEGSTLLDKARMFDFTPFRETLYLDADTVVLERLDLGFEKARQYTLACCICECPYARRFPSLAALDDFRTITNPGGQHLERDASGRMSILETAETVSREPIGRRDIIEYNTGVLFFTNYAASLFERWKDLSKQVDSRLPFINDGELCVMPTNDQASFAMAVDQRISPFVLPLNWNYRPQWHKSFFGPVKVWHAYDEVPQSFQDWNAKQQPGAVIEFARCA